ncbi:DUF2264 domain-containing protein [Lapidilactobacillus luobeiensis]|uniref:DUF2264 domain-containing protein n=1 Tax=Lapidilactobacillus luobeiensis TaxID=2950371 RepID=UPI0021C4C33D|nr:DUF2264 domain-containing protein [Lapidilactobacillus luobeiensis]
MTISDLRKNPLQTKEDFDQAFLELIEPLKEIISAEGPRGRLDLGSSGTVYSEDEREIEAFLRPLWGLGPYLQGQEHPESIYLNSYLQGIKKGTDPDNEAYWHDITDFDQTIVEMAALSTFLIMNRQLVLTNFNDHELLKLQNWLLQVNQHQLPDNNWHFFRVLVNVALKKLNLTYSQEMIEQDLDRINEFYAGDGWYFDGAPVQRDYYVSFAIQFYSLLYYKFMNQEDPQRCQLISERAVMFANNFKYWFDADGEAIPFGRSLTYRFAQSAFFSGLVYADIEALPWGEIKGLLQRNLHQWFNQDIFSKDGLLTIGYHYQNLVFAEGYNGPGSPYWSFKVFALLGVPAEHPFWLAKAEPLKVLENKPSVDGRNWYQHSDDDHHLQCFPAGQFVTFQTHASAKYSKYVYSSKFGFSAPKANYWYYEGAYDNCLALAEDDHYFRTKPLDDDFELLDDRIIHYWHPWADVSIKTTIVPWGDWHIRIEELDSARELDAYEGGFSVPFRGSSYQNVDRSRATYDSQMGRSSIEGVVGFLEAGFTKTEPNTNLFFPLAGLPFLKTHLQVGQHLLVSAVLGAPKGYEQNERPTIQIAENSLQIFDSFKQVQIDLRRK